MSNTSKSSKWGPIFFIVLFLLIFVVLFYSFQRFFNLPKILILTLIFLSAAFIGRLQALIKDWFVFIAFIYLFDSLRGTIYLLTCKLSLPVYTLYVIKIEKLLFNQIPSVFLQSRLLDTMSPGNFSWLEKILTFFHGSHFVAFLLIGFLIWLNKLYYFRLYKISFYLAMGVGLLGYLFVPTVPPWMAASQFTLIPPLTHFNVVLYNMLIPDISNGFDTNPIAAMPSLHALFPILCSLLLWSFYRWKAVPFYLYTLLVLFTIIYSGDHYVTDVLAGMVLAITCYFTATKIFRFTVDNQENPSSEPSTFGFSNLKRPVIFGSIILILGISIGQINKREFAGHPKDYSLNAPKFVDFIDHQEKYKTNFQIQFYFGKYYSVREEYKKALPFFQQCLALANNPNQEKTAKQQITFCTRMIQVQSKW
jgi:membrane-associated phospholipid phosphatase